MKTFKKYYYLFILLSVVFFIIYHVYSSYRDKQKFINSSYNGIIMEIKFIEGQHGDMNIKINNTWRLCSWENKIGNYIKIGDSIVKSPENTDIYIYRKDTINDKWVLKVFKNI